MRRILFLIGFCLVFSMQFTQTAFAAKQVNLIIDSKLVNFDLENGMPFIDDVGRVQVPLRASLEAFDARVSWNQKEQIAYIQKDNIDIEVMVGKNYIFVNGIMVKNDTTALLINGRVYLPIAAVFKSLGAEVTWDKKNYNVLVKSNENNGLLVYNNVVHQTEINGNPYPIKASEKKASYIVYDKNVYIEKDYLSELIKGNRYGFKIEKRDGSKVAVVKEGKESKDPITYKGKFFGLSKTKGTITYKSDTKRYKIDIDLNNVLNNKYAIYKEKIYLPIDSVFKDLNIKYDIIYDINQNILEVNF